MVRRKRYLKIQDKGRLAAENTEEENLVGSFEELVYSPRFGNTENSLPMKICVTAGLNKISVTSLNAQGNIQLISQVKDTSTMTDSTAIDNLSEELKRMLVLNKKKREINS